MINKNKLVFDPADAANSDYVGSYIIGADGTEITRTNVGGKDGLDVNLINASLVVTATDLDIRDLAFATDKVDVSGSTIALDAGTLAALESITVSATDLDIRDLSHAQDSIKIGDGVDFLAVNADGSININVATLPGNYAEDSGHISGDIGNFMLGVRNDAGATIFTSADGDYSPIAVTNTGSVRVAVNFTAADGGALPSQQAVIAGYDGSLVQAIKTDAAGELQIDVLTMPGIYLEDSAHVSGDMGSLGLVVRKDVAGSFVSADGDYSPLQVDANGSLRVAATFDAAGDYAEDSAHVSGDIGLYMLSVREDLLASSTSATGDYQSLKTDALGRLYANNSNQTMSNAAVSVLVTATDLAATDLVNRKRILIQNLGTKKIYIGKDATVTTANGIELFAGASMELDIGPAVNVHAISSLGTQDVRIMELA